MRQGKKGFTLAELMVALLFISIALFGYIALQMRLIDSSEKIISKQNALETAEAKLSQSATGYRRQSTSGRPITYRTVAEASWEDRNGTHHYLVDSLTLPVRAGW